MGEEPGVMDYIRRLKERRWAMLSVFLLVFFLVACITFLTKPVYKATAEVYIDPGLGSQLNFQPVSDPFENKVFLQTQISILTSDAIAGQVVAKLHLYEPAGETTGSLLSLSRLLSFIGISLPDGPSNAQERDDAIKGFKSNREVKSKRKLHLYKPAGETTGSLLSLSRLLSFIRISLPGRPSNAHERDDAIKRFKSNLKVDSNRNGNIVEVSFSDENPEVAADAVNTTIQTSIKQNLEIKEAPAKEAVTWLNGKLGEMKNNMTATANRLQDFKRDENLVITGDKEENIPLRTLADLNTSILAAEVKRRTAEVKYQRVEELSGSKDGFMSLPEVINNRLMQDLQTQLALLSKQSAEASKMWGEKHPKTIRLKNEMAALESQVHEEVSHIVASIKNEYRDSVKAEQSLRRALAAHQQEAISYERRSAVYDMKKRVLAGNEEMYDAVLKKFQESKVMGNINISNIRFLHRALPPLSPDKPKIKDLAVGFVVALFLSLGYGTIRERLDNTYKNPDDIETNLGLAVLGIVPRSKMLERRRQETAPVHTSKPAYLVVESFRNIKHNIMLKAMDSRPKVIQVSSAMSSEGKSTVALYLASSHALTGDNVLIIDGDMRRPSLHRRLNVPNRNGLSSVLSGKANLEDVVINTRIRNLSFIPSGPPVAESGELLSSLEMRDMLRELRGKYDRIIIDSSPFLGPADSYLLTQLTDGIVLVVLSGKTERDMVLKVMKNLEAMKAKVLGCVLNDVTNKSHHYYHYYYGDYKVRSGSDRI